MESQCFGFFCKKFNLEMKFLNYCDNDHGFLTLIHHHWIFILKCSSVLQVLNNLPVIWSTELFVDPFWLTKKPFDFEQKVVSESSGVYTIHHYQISESPGLFAKIELIRIHRRISFRALDQFTYGELGSKYCAGFERLFWCWSVWLCKWWNGFKRLQSFSGTCFRQAALKFPCNLYWNR